MKPHKPSAECMEPSAPSTRFAPAMWDFSWLVRRFGGENEYQDANEILEGLSQRGYDCVRIDAFPHLIAAIADAGVPDSFTIQPQRRYFPWGNHSPVTVSPKAALVDFVRTAARHHVRVALSSWFIDDGDHHRLRIRTPDDLTGVWRRTLTTLADEGLLSQIAWVDLCNEFPVGEWLPGTYQWIFGARWPNAVPLALPWSDTMSRRVQRFYSECIPVLRESFPDLPYTFSMQRFGFGEIRRLDVGAFDLAEVHVWLAEMAHFNVLSGHLPGVLCLPGGIPLHRAVGGTVYHLAKEFWHSELSRRMDDWAVWAKEKGLPLVTTEGWGPTNYDSAQGAKDDRKWRWVKESCAYAAHMACEKGWQGVCTSNFCQPHFPDMWNDVRWHREVTRMIRSATQSPNATR